MCKAIQELQDEAVDIAVAETVRKEREKQQEAVGIAVAETVRKEREKQQEAVAEATLRAVKSLMKNLSLSVDQALSTLSLSESECAILKPMLQTQ